MQKVPVLAHRGRSAQLGTIPAWRQHMHAATPCGAYWPTAHALGVRSCFDNDGGLFEDLGTEFRVRCRPFTRRQAAAGLLRPICGSQSHDI